MLEYAKMKGFESFKERVNVEATFNEYVGVDCDVIAAEYPTDAEIIQTIKRGADIDCEVLEDDIGEDDFSEVTLSWSTRRNQCLRDCKIIHSSTRKCQ
jgi:hypothetical protein